jgi:AraC-like DNA-binding protein
MEIVGIINFIFGVFLSGRTFLFKEGYAGANRFLAAFLFFWSLLFFVSFEYFIQNSGKVLLCSTYGVFHSYFLIGPFAFFYVRSILRDNAGLRVGDYLHFGLFVVFMLGNIPYILSPAEEKAALVEILQTYDWNRFAGIQVNVFLPFRYIETLRIVSLTGYGIALWALILKYPFPPAVNERQKRHYAFVRQWLVVFSATYSIMAIQRVLIYALLAVAQDKAALVMISVFSFLSISLVFLLLNLFVFLFPKLSYGLLVTPSDFLAAGKGVELALAAGADAPVGQIEAGYSWHKSYFQDDYIGHIESRLARWSLEKKYLGNASIAGLSEETGIPAHHLSYYFNHVLGVKFTDWRNTQRIDHAKALLDDGFHHTYTMEALAEQCGFNARATFFRVFREIAGVTPLEYIRGEKDEGAENLD